MPQMNIIRQIQYNADERRGRVPHIAAAIQIHYSLGSSLFPSINSLLTITIYY